MEKKIDSLSNQFYEDLQKICQMIKKFVGLLKEKYTISGNISKIIYKIVAHQFQKAYCSDRHLTAQQLFNNEGGILTSIITAIYKELEQVEIKEREEEVVPRTESIEASLLLRLSIKPEIPERTPLAPKPANIPEALATSGKLEAKVL